MLRNLFPVMNFQADGEGGGETDATEIKITQGALNARLKAERVATEARMTERLGAKLDSLTATHTALDADYKKAQARIAELEPLGAKAAEADTLRRELTNRDIDGKLMELGCSPKHAKHVRILLAEEAALPTDLKNVTDWAPIVAKAKELHPAAFGTPMQPPSGGAPPAGKTPPGTKPVDSLASFRTNMGAGG